MMLEREVETFERELPQMLAQHAGKFALIQGDTLAGVYDTQEEAVEAVAGRKRSQLFYDPRPLLCGSISQVLAMGGFLLAHDEASLFAVATFFGLGFAGMVPAYVPAVRELFPATEAPGASRRC